MIIYIMTEKEIIERIVKGDKYLFAKLYKYYYSYVFYRIYNFIGNITEAEDLVQNVWIKIYFAINKFKSDSSFKTWIYKITTNECINYLKSKRVLIDLDRIVDTLQVSRDPTKDIENEIDVTNLLSILSKLERTLLVFKYIDEYTYVEISQITGLSESAVKMRINRAKIKLKNEKNNA